MLGFVEEMVLLQLDETQGGLVDLPRSAADIVLAGAAVMELALLNRVDSDLERLFVVDAAPTGDDMLDGALHELAAEGAALTAIAAIERLTVNAEKYRQEALRRLVANGILREENGRHFWVFRTRRYPVIDDREQREVKGRLRQILLTDEIPDPRDVVLICLIEACELLGLVLAADEIARTKTRVAELSRLDLIGQAVTRAVAEIRFMIRHSSAPVF
ncbi:MAG TPA: GPP34 family phosphoprotein [Stellaceae bacterium]|nr:GPP34 family phosphoprotein [Stellaceae bacterium]